MTSTLLSLFKKLSVTQRENFHPTQPATFVMLRENLWNAMHCVRYEAWKFSRNAAVKIHRTQFNVYYTNYEAWKFGYTWQMATL